jgi:hypothetical protein
MDLVGSLKFESSRINQYLVVSPSSALVFPGDCTIEFFCKCSVTPGNNGILIAAGPSGPLMIAVNRAIERNAKMYFDTSSFSPYQPQAEINDNVWHHVAFVRKGMSTNNVSVFIDGAFDGSITEYSTWNYGSGFLIGGFILNGEPYQPNSYNGLLSNLRICNNAVYDAPFEVQLDNNLSSIPGTVLLLNTAFNNPYVDSSPNAIVITPTLNNNPTPLKDSPITLNISLSLGEKVIINKSDVRFNDANVFVKDPSLALNVSNKQYVDIADEEINELILASAATYTTSTTEYSDLIDQRQAVQITLAAQIENLYQYFFNQSRLDALIYTRPFDVLTIDGCCLWLDGADSDSIVTSSTSVTTWKDKSTKRYNFTQTNSFNQPTYTTNALNGNSVISFSKNYQNYLGGPSGFILGTNSYSLFAVCKFNDDYSSGSIFNRSAYAYASGRIIVIREGTLYKIGYNRGDPDNPTKPSELFYHQTESAQQYQILEVVVNRVQGHDEMYRNGIKLTENSYSSDIDSTYSSANAYNMIVGGYNNASGGINPPSSDYYLDGAIAEIVAFSNPYDMTNSTRQEIEGYLAKKWGLQSILPNDHPFKNE